MSPGAGARAASLACLGLLLACDRREPQQGAPEPAATSAATIAAAQPALPSAAPVEPSASAASSASASVKPPSPPLTLLAKQRAPHDYAKGPFYFTPAYDGSLRFSLWLGTMAFARRMEAQHGQRPHFTFFVNGAFYTTEKVESDVGHATTRAEVLVRRALTQQAINEGHEIGNHGMGHLDGRAFDLAGWAAELDRFHTTMDFTLFEPVTDADGRFVFPRFEALADAPARGTGAACKTDDDCDSRRCVALTAESSLCTEPCNLKHRCPKGTACGAPMFREDTDLCLPPPAFPVVHEGEFLFDARGNANPKSKRLRPYRIVGFRAPYLGANDALYEALAARDYVYDTSQATSPPEPPYFLATPSMKRPILELALMPHPGALAVPMDYNYRLEKGSPERMKADYRAAIESSYRDGHRPWNVGHHFASWGEGTYLTVLEDTVEHVVAGCPDEHGERHCPEARAVSFRELAKTTREP
jgi:peptidoglycan/xylan/chitin deacetylase (PgdA/CDA1 family)